VETPRLGPLELQNGYPTATTARKLYDELDLQRATQSYLWALPAVGFKALYDAQAKTMGVRNGDVLLYRTLQDKAGMLTPNITTLYAFSFWDLAKQGPLVVEVPAGLTAGGVLDIWQQPITDMGQTGPDKGAGGKYLIIPPGGPEVVAPGYRIFRSPSNQVWFGTRGLAPDKALAEATVRQHRLYGWNQRAYPPATGYSEVGGRPSRGRHLPVRRTQLDGHGAQGHHQGVPGGNRLRRHPHPHPVERARRHPRPACDSGPIRPHPPVALHGPTCAASSSSGGLACLGRQQSRGDRIHHLPQRPVAVHARRAIGASHAARFARIGISPGLSFDTARLDPKLRTALEEGVAEASRDLKAKGQQQTSSRGFFGTREELGPDYISFRSMGALLGIYGNSDAEAFYASQQTGPDGQVLDGRRKWVLRFPAGQLPPVSQFWSITMYKLPERLLVENPIQRYSIGDRTQGLKRGADGSLEIYLQHDNPGPAKASNWLPAPAGPFFFVGRLYGPGPSALSEQWQLPALQERP
jgi:hypothetical protein